MQIINAVYYTRTLWTHMGWNTNANINPYHVGSCIKKLLLLVYFHEEYVENQQRVLMLADSGIHCFHWSSQTPNYFWIFPSLCSEWNTIFQQPNVIILRWRYKEAHIQLGTLETTSPNHWWGRLVPCDQHVSSF